MSGVSFWTGGRAGAGWRWTAFVPHPSGGGLFVGEASRSFVTRAGAVEDFERWCDAVSPPAFRELTG